MLVTEMAWEGSEYLNYWNLNQMFLIEGRSTYSLIEKFVNAVKLNNKYCKVTVGSLLVKNLVNNETKEEIKWLAAQSLRFANLFN